MSWSVLQDGEPWIVLRAVEDAPDRLSALYDQLARFRRLIEERRSEVSVPWEEAKKQLGAGA